MLFHNNNSFSANFLVSKIQHAQVSIECHRHLYNKNKNWSHILRLIYTSDFRARFCSKLVPFTEYNYFYNFYLDQKETKTNTNFHIWLELSIFSARCNFKFEFWREAIVGIIKAEWPEVWKKMPNFQKCSQNCSQITKAQSRK